MTKPGYKMTEVGELPEGWRVKKINEVADLRKEQVMPDNFEGDVYVGLEHIFSGHSRISRFGSPENVRSAKWEFHGGDILYGKLRPYLDKVAIAECAGMCSTDILVVRANEIRTKFLLFLLHTGRLTEYATSSSVGTNHPRVSWKSLGEFQIPVPPDFEQQKIAEILSTVDDAIQKVTDEILLTEKLKKGLMQTLLTKGIGHTRFKQTEIGDIPEEWGIGRVGEIFTTLTGTTPSTKVSDYWEMGSIEWLTPKDLSSMNTSLKVPPSERKVTEKALREVNLSILPRNSILMSTRAPVGYVGVNEVEITFNQGCKGLVPVNRDEVKPYFYAYYLFNKSNYLNSISGGSTFKELSKEGLKNVMVPTLPSNEQQKIAEILSTVDEKLTLLNNKKDKLENLKKGLMNDLLTGKVRVKVS